MHMNSAGKGFDEVLDYVKKLERVHNWVMLRC